MSSTNGHGQILVDGNRHRQRRAQESERFLDDGTQSDNPLLAFTSTAEG
jgi:hypothetical protein